jgi:hypothetical protein
MTLQIDLDYAGTLAAHEFERFASLIAPAWIDQALSQTGTVSLRRRRLPAKRMVWLVIGLALFRNAPIWHIVERLDPADGPTLSTPVPGAAVAGRERLGEAPMAWLFGQLAMCWGSGSVAEHELFHGLRSYAVDGVVWSLPDHPLQRYAATRRAQGDQLDRLQRIVGLLKFLPGMMDLSFLAQIGFAADNGTGTYEIPFLDRTFIVLWMVIAGMVRFSHIGACGHVRSFHVDRKPFRVEGAFALGSAVICVLLSAIYGGLW